MLNTWGIPGHNPSDPPVTPPKVKKKKKSTKGPASGIEAISSPMPTGPIAMPRMIRGEDGMMHTVYYDPSTNQPISSLSGYTIVDGSTNYTVTPTDDKNKDGKVDTKEANSGIFGLGNSSSTPSDSNPSPDSGGFGNFGGTGSSSSTSSGSSSSSSSKPPEFLGHTSRQDADHSGDSFKTNQNPLDNYGYEHKPGFVSKLGMLPGGIGMAAKAVNAGWNMNNLAAVNTARNMLNLAPMTPKDSVKGIVKDTKGQVSNNAQINGKSYHVGLEAMSPDENTNLTPTEANNRANLLGGISEPAPTAPQQSGLSKKLNNMFFEDNPVAPTPETPQTPQAQTLQSPIEKITGVQKGWAARALNHVFGITPENAPTPTARPEDTPTSVAPSITPASPDTGVSTPSGVAHAASIAGFNPGAGLGNLDHSAQGTGPNNISYDHPDRGAWNAGMTQETQDTASRVAGTLGGMTMTSGYRSPSVNAAVGGAPGSLHQQGKAFDIDTSNMTDSDKQKAVEMSRLSGATGIGTYTGGSLHIDMGARPSATAVDAQGNPVHPGAINTVDGTYGMMNRTATNAAKNAPSWFTKGMTEDTFAPTPTARPTPTPSETLGITPEVDRNSSAQALGFTATPNDAPVNTFNNIGPTAQVSQPSVIDSTTAKLGTTPAARAAMGMINRTPAEKTAMAKTIAGELSPQSLAALAKNDPTAKAELGAMVATMENRAASKTYTGIANTLAPSQYNSLAAANLNTTNANYSKYQAAINTGMQDFYSGKLPSNLDKTSYYNPSISNPSWGTKMTNPTQVGAHKFGTLPEYSPDANAVAAAKAMNTMATTTYSPGKAKDDTVGTGYQPGAAGYTPGGLGSPSNSIGGGYSPSTGASPGPASSTNQSSPAGTPGGIGSPSASVSGNGSGHGGVVGDHDNGWGGH